MNRRNSHERLPAAPCTVLHGEPSGGIRFSIGPSLQASLIRTSSLRAANRSAQALRGALQLLVHERSSLQVVHPWSVIVSRRGKETAQPAGSRTHAESHPPLARLPAALGARILLAVHIPLDQPCDRLLPRVGQVRAEGVGADAVSRGRAGKDLVQREARLAGEGELRDGVRAQVLQGVLRAPGPGCGGCGCGCGSGSGSGSAPG